MQEAIHALVSSTATSRAECARSHRQVTMHPPYAEGAAGSAGLRHPLARAAGNAGPVPGCGPGRGAGKRCGGIALIGTTGDRHVGWYKRNTKKCGCGGVFDPAAAITFCVYG